MPLPRLAWLSCLRDRPPNCQRTTGCAPDGLGRRPPGTGPRHPTGRWPGGEAVAATAPPRAQRVGRCGPDRLRAIASIGRSTVFVARCEPPGEAGVSRPSVAGGRRRCGLPGAGVGTPADGLGPGFLSEILRKEVIQPQVPLRLPCYDLVPITGFIFGACLDGSGDFGCPPLWWLDGRCVQGSGTHSPRQC